MTLSVKKALQQRTAIRLFDATKTLDDKQIVDLVHLATLAPSAFNLQNWHFLAVKSTEAKQRLHACAYKQQRILDAAVTFIVCGEMEPHKKFDRVAQSLVERGGISAEAAAAWHNKVVSFLENNTVAQHAEAFRSASLAAMALMLAAEEQGLATGPMSGFDANAIRATFDLPETRIPVMLVSVGYAAEGNTPQNVRLHVEHVLDIL